MHCASCTEAEREAQFYYDFYAARQAMDRGQYDRAYYLLTLCHTILPEDGKTLEYLGIIYDALKQKDEAASFFTRAYACSPKEFYRHHLNYLIEAKDWDEAFRVAKQATRDNDDDPDAWNSLLQVSMPLGDYKTATQAVDAIDRILGPSRYTALVRYEIAIRQPKTKPKDLVPIYESVLELDPDNALILNNYAFFLATHKGDLNRAEQMSQRAIQMQPENPSFLDTYGWILHLKKQDILAKFYLQKALTIIGNQPGNIQIRKHLGKIK